MARYSYDALNRRMRKIVASPSPVPPEAGHPLPQGERAVKEYLYDGWQEIIEYVDGRPSKEFVFGQRLDEPVVMIDHNGEPKKYFYQTDRLGSVTALTDEQGTVVERYRYDAYGALIQLAKDSEKTGGIANPFRYTGRYFDNETGLYYYRNRYYSPELGRFVTRDPAKYFDGMNLYAYVNNQPTYFVDPMGLWSTKVHNLMIEDAFWGLGEKQIEKIKEGSKEADSLKYQTASYSYMHAMRAPWESKERASQKMNDYYVSKIRKAAEFISIGAYASGYKEFGMAIHPLMDSTSPEHRGFQVWLGAGCFTPLGVTCVKHYLSESDPSLGEMQETLEFLHKAYNDLQREVEILTKSNKKKQEKAVQKSKAQGPDVIYL